MSDLPSAKQDLRQHCWRALQASGAARWPGTVGRIPNFVGAEEARRRLANTEIWQRARVLKANPDSPQRPVRAQALLAGMRLYMAVPKLAAPHPFIELDPDTIPASSLWEASSKAGADRWGRPVSLDEMPPIDLIVTGCVGVTREGARLGKGGGYADLEYALLREAGKVTGSTPIVSTVHDSQVLADGAVPMSEHDTSLDLFCTPEEVVTCPRPFPRPQGVLWERLPAAKLAAIPVLGARRPG